MSQPSATHLGKDPCLAQEQRNQAPLAYAWTQVRLLGTILAPFSDDDGTSPGVSGPTSTL